MPLQTRPRDDTDSLAVFVACGHTSITPGTRRALRWSVLKETLWLRAPRHRRTGRGGGRLCWILVPCILLVAAKEQLPKVPAPVERDQGLFLQSAAGQEFFSGNWPWFTVIITMMILNTVLGEELLFHGLLLPRMRGA